MKHFHQPGEAAVWLKAQVRGTLQTNSRKIRPGDGFIAWPGAATDSRQFVKQVLLNGAAACLVESEGVEAYPFEDSQIAAYTALKADAALIAADYFDHPSHRMEIVAVTGTNGKTSTTWWLAQAMGKAARKCGLVGTLGIGEPGSMVFNGLTTPDPVLLQQQLRAFADAGFGACAIEASSIGIAEHRLNGTRVAVAVLTNFTHDHLDYHSSMDAYWQAKKSLFFWTGLKAAVLNLDDEKGRLLASELNPAELDVWTFAVNGHARLSAQNIKFCGSATDFDVVEGTETCKISIQSVGLFNVANLLAVLATLRALGVSLEAATQACCDLMPVPGRLEPIAVDAMPLVFVDYAHTPDALEKALSALVDVTTQRQGRLWCLFGCGGDRDAAKRPLMGTVAQKYAHEIVVTTDNPRGEDPSSIIQQILAGATRATGVHVVVDRNVAISMAISKASPRDVVLIAGKGHENYQEVMGVRTPFSDQDHVLNALRQRSGNLTLGLDQS